MHQAPPNASGDTQAIRDSFVQLWGSMGSFWGVSPTTARIFGWLLSRSEPAEAEEIMAGLELSRGSVSMACKELREWGLVTPERQGRRTVYAPETDLERVVRHVVQIRKRREWDPILEHLGEWVPALEGDPSPEAAVFAERLRAIEALVELADGLVDRVLRGGTVTNLGLKLLVGRSRRVQAAHAGPVASSAVRSLSVDPDVPDVLSGGKKS
jgi:DNA-binding transcriptional regulator GbsR (MarR family)